MRSLAPPPQIFPILFLFLAGINGGAISVVSASPSVRFELLRWGQLPYHKRHRHSTAVAHTGSSFIAAAARDDAARQEFIRARLEEQQQRRRPDVRGRGRKACESSRSPSFAMPVSSGAYSGIGQYFVKFQVGTPAQKSLLVVDTGSDLTWMKCRYKAAGGNSSATSSRGSRTPTSKKTPTNTSTTRRLFDAGSSKSFHPIGCSTKLCTATLPFSLSLCPSPTTPCSYDYGYADGSRAQGVFANESASVVLSPGKRRVKLNGIVVGCTSTFTGQSFRTADGVLGLGYSKTSFAARATSLFGGKFSYCLVDHLSPKNVSNYLVFGSDAKTMRYAELVIEPRLEPFYAVRVIGISIGRDMLNDIPASVWDVSTGGGAIVDSGTSLTILAEPAYKSVTSALTRSMLAHHPRLVDGIVKPFDFCYNTTLPHSFDESAVPKLVIHLRGAGGHGQTVRLEPPVKSYVVDVADGVKCLGFLSAPSGGVSTFGNILQQNHRWEFDIANRRLGFARSNC